MLPLDPSKQPDHGTSIYLPVRPRPYQDESAHGFLNRVAHENGYETPYQHYSAIQRRGLVGKNALQECLGLTDMEWHNLAGPWPRYFDAEDRLWSDLSRDDYVQDIFRWCPKCLALSPYLRSAWSIKLCVTCLDHGNYLLDACPNCHRRQRIEYLSGLRCVCGHLLAACGSLEATSCVLDLQSAFLSNSPHQISNRIPQLVASAWSRLLLCIAAITMQSRKGKTGQIAGLRNLSTAVSVVQQAAEILSDWPSGFRRHLTKIQFQSDVSFSLHQTFGRLYRKLYVDLAGAEFDFLREEFNAYLAENWWGLICRRNRRIKENSQRTTLKEAAKISGLSISQIKQLHFAGIVDATSVAHRSGRQSWSLPLAEVSTLASLVDDGMTLKMASSFLALPKHRVRELVDAGLIRPRLIAGRNGSSIWNFSSSELDQLGRIKGGRNFVPTPDLMGGEIVPLIQVLKTWRLPSGAFPALMAAISKGEISGIGQRPPDVSVGQISMPSLQLKSWLLQWKELHWGCMSITAAARALGIKEQVAYDLVRVGLLATDTVGSTSTRRVKVETIKQFQNTYITAIELSKIIGISLKELFSETGIQPITGPSIDGSRQYFFNRSDFSL